MTTLFTSESKWIWLDGSWTPNRYAEIRGTFTAQPGQAVFLHLSVEGQYASFINGVRVPSTQYSDFPCAKSVQRPDVSHLVQQGQNELLIQCWYPGEDTSVTRREAPGLRFELRQENALLLVSDESTEIRPIAAYDDGPVPLITGQLGTGFSRRFAEPASWRKAVCVDKPAGCVPRPVKELRIDPCPPAALVSQGTFQLAGGKDVGQRMQYAGLFWKDLNAMTNGKTASLPAESGVHFRADHGDGIYLVLDLGRLYEGYPVLDVVCPENTQIDVGFGEHLEDLRVRTTIGSRCLAVTCTAGPQRERFVHWFRRLGCRYLQLFIHSREAVVYEAGILPAFYPVDERPSMRLSDPLHNRIAETCRETLLACMHDHYEDCPWREQALYAFDSRNQMLAGYYAFGEFAFARENLRLLALSQREDGLLELCAPARISITIPSFSMAFIMTLEEYCRYSGDLAFGREMLPVAERILDTLRAQVCDGLAWRMTDPKYWNFYEWQPLLEGNPAPDVPSAEAGLQMFGLLALQRMRALKAMLDMDSRSADLALEAELELGLEQFWDEENQAYASYLRGGEKLQYAELIQSLALYAGVVPENRRNPLREKLMRGGLVPVTLSYSLFKYEALLQDPANTKAVFDEIARRWGAMLFRGATTFWEVDEGAEAFSRAGSLCHGWSAIPYYLYGAYVLGVRPEAPGVWKQHETCAGLEISATLLSPDGCFEVNTP